MGGMHRPPMPPDPYAFSSPPRRHVPLQMPSPLPWLYRDPQRWLLPSLTLAAIVIAAAIAGW